MVVRKYLGGVGTTNHYLRNLLRKGLRPKITLRCDTPEGVKQVVRDQLAVDLLFRDVVEKNIKRGEFKVIKLPGETFEGKSLIVYHKTRSLSPVAQEFLKLLSSQKRRR